MHKTIINIGVDVDEGWRYNNWTWPTYSEMCGSSLAGGRPRRMRCWFVNRLCQLNFTLPIHYQQRSPRPRTDEMMTRCMTGDDLHQHSPIILGLPSQNHAFGFVLWQIIPTIIRSIISHLFLRPRSIEHRKRTSFSSIISSIVSGNSCKQRLGVGMRWDQQRSYVPTVTLTCCWLLLEIINSNSVINMALILFAGFDLEIADGDGWKITSFFLLGCCHFIATYPLMMTMLLFYICGWLGQFIFPVQGGSWCWIGTALEIWEENCRFTMCSQLQLRRLLRPTSEAKWSELYRKGE